MEEISRASGSVGLSYGAHSNLCINQLVLDISINYFSAYSNQILVHCSNSVYLYVGPAWELCTETEVSSKGFKPKPKVLISEA